MKNLLLYFFIFLTGHAALADLKPAFYLNNDQAKVFRKRMHQGDNSHLLTALNNDFDLIRTASPQPVISINYEGLLDTDPLRQVIFILADDLGYGDVGFNGQEKIPTPNLDQLSGEGMKMKRFYAGAPVCAPSRCTLLTGKHTGHASVRGNKSIPGIGASPLSPEDVTIAEALQNSGYITGITADSSWAG